MNGNEIRRRREARGLTQEQLAAQLGVGQRTVGNWERGATVPLNRMGMLQALFGLDEPAESDDPIRAASDVALLAELMRRAAARQGGQAAS